MSKFLSIGEPSANRIVAARFHGWQRSTRPTPSSSGEEPCRRSASSVYREHEGSKRQPGRGAARRASGRRGRRAPRVTRAESGAVRGGRRAPCSRPKACGELGDARRARSVAGARLGDHHEIDRRRERGRATGTSLAPDASDGFAPPRRPRAADREAEARGSGTFEREHDEVGAVSPATLPLDRVKSLESLTRELCRRTSPRELDGLRGRPPGGLVAPGGLRRDLDGEPLAPLCAPFEHVATSRSLHAREKSVGPLTPQLLG